jgi:Uma2 family endonuclease
MSVETKLMTAEELLQMPDDGMRHELVEGELRTMSPAGWEHGLIAARILTHLREYVIRHGLGDVCAADTGFFLARDPDSVRGPDAAFVRKERFVKTKKFFPGAPDLAVEVVSPNDKWSEVEEKVRHYLNTGAQRVIVVDPKTRGAIISTPKERVVAEDVIDGGDVVPGWSMTFAEIFD